MTHKVTYEEFITGNPSNNIVFTIASANEGAEQKKLQLSFPDGTLYFLVKYKHNNTNSSNTEYFHKLREAIEKYNKI